MRWDAALLVDRALTAQLFKDNALINDFTVVQNGSKRSAVKPAMAGRGTYVQKDMQNGYLRITSCHMITFMQHCPVPFLENFLNNDKLD